MCFWKLLTPWKIKDLRVFHSVCQVLMNPDFWKWTFVICRALYAPMRVLCLADQKSAAMDKLNYYVLQTDRMLAMYCKAAEERGAGLLTPSTIRAMDCSTSAGSSADENLGSEHEENGVDDGDDNDSNSAQSSATKNINDDGSDDEEQQVFFMWTFAFI